MTTKCDIVRDIANAIQCDACKMHSLSPSCPASLSDFTDSDLNAICSATASMNVKMEYFADTYFRPISRNKDADKTMDAILEANVHALGAVYPDATDVDLSWFDVQHCLWNTNGDAGGQFQNVYFGRDDIEVMGFNPPYPVGGKLMSGKIWKPPKASVLPVYLDYFINPDLFVIVLIILLASIFLGLVIAKKRKDHKVAHLHSEQRPVS